jgi:uncharacterized protein (DUF1684 family)
MKIFGKNNKRFLFTLLYFISILLFSGKSAPLLKAEENLIENRIEKLKTMRENRDKFFKEDPKSPLKEPDRKRFKGLNYYPIDLKYTIIGVIEKYPIEPKPIYVTLPTNKEVGKKYIKYGKFKFKLDGKEYILQVYRPLGGGELFLPFKDKTSGRGTYPRGRYLFIEPLPDGKVIIDFNRAYNPFCEYNEKYLCPFAPEENWLPIEIRAGEKRYR